ncbi:hypothetical protein BKA70DRAFT_376266 [Coprinopsis sp. MPI-PUGE-AT-0042]|nr:hypothetical protein BKA70DRAFT_376266 [Coprinopsis sp. MPI-PUGE-AT-0042]
MGQCPYGSFSPVTINLDTGKPYGPRFSLTMVRDDARTCKAALDSLSFNSVTVVTGASMGGVAVLEWPLRTPQGDTRNVIPRPQPDTRDGAFHGAKLSDTVSTAAQAVERSLQPLACQWPCSHSDPCVTLSQSGWLRKSAREETTKAQSICVDLE